MSDPVDRTGTTPTRTPRWVKWALAGSLSLNLLILGLVGGAALGLQRNFAGGGDEGPGLRPLGLGPFALAISREDRDALRDSIDLRAVRGEGRALTRALRDIQTALRADPFDRALAEDAFGRTRGATTAMQGVGHAALLDQFARMSLEDRAEVAERVERALRRQTNGPRPSGER